MAKNALHTTTAGYKHTEIGVIPEEWDLVTFDEAFEFLRTASYSRDKLGSTGEVKYIHYGDIHTKWNYFVDMSRSSIPTVGPEMIVNYSQIKDGDLVIADASEDYEGIGKSVEVTNLSPHKAIAGLHTFLLRDKDHHFVDGFKGYICSNPLVKPSLDRYATGLKVYGISKNNLKLVQIPKPPIPEQSAIVTALRDTDALIESLEKFIAKKRAIKQGAMQELLTGKLRLPGFSGNWITKAIADIGEITGSGVDKKIRPDEQPIRLLNYLDVFRRDFIYSEELHHWVTATPALSQRCAIKKGDVFFTPSSEMRYDIAISAVAMEDMPDVAYSYHVVRLRMVEDWDLTFRAYAFKTKGFIDQAETICEGSGKRYVISLTKFRGMTVFYPPTKKEQSAIASILWDMDSEIAGLQEQLGKLRLLKQGMMQALLTGKIRLLSK